MSQNINSTSSNTLIVIGLGIVAALIIFAVLTNQSIPLIVNERGALVLLLVIGMAMCAVGGIGPTITRYGWTSPIFVVGAVLGVLMLLIPAAVLVGVQIPLITGAREAVVALAILGLVKIVVNIVYGVMAGGGA